MKSSESRYRQCLYFTASALARKVEKLALESWKKIDLSPSLAYLLMAVLDEPGIQPGSLAEEMQLTPSTITRLVEKLEEKKLLIRTTEGKLTNVYPTPKAKALHPRLKELIQEFYEKYAAILGKEACSRFINNMHTMADQL